MMAVLPSPASAEQIMIPELSSGSSGTTSHSMQPWMQGSMPSAEGCYVEACSADYGMQGEMVPVHSGNWTGGHVMVGVPVWPTGETVATGCQVVSAPMMSCSDGQVMPYTSPVMQECYAPAMEAWGTPIVAQCFPANCAPGGTASMQVVQFVGVGYWSPQEQGQASSQVSPMTPSSEGTIPSTPADTPRGDHLPLHAPYPPPAHEAPRCLPDELHDGDLSHLLPPGMAGQVWQMSRDANGCWEVERVVKDAKLHGDLQTQRAVVAELKGHVLEALKCPHANYVIQECVQQMPASCLQFIIDELSGFWREMAMHRYGCRTLERLLEHCPTSQLECMYEDLVPVVATLSYQQFGNYVVQHLLRYGTPAWQRGVARGIECMVGGEALKDREEGYLWACITKGLTIDDNETRDILAQAILQQPGLAAAMARTRHGHMAIQTLLEGPWREETRQQLSRSSAALWSSRYGRAIAQVAAL